MGNLEEEYLRCKKTKGQSCPNNDNSQDWDIGGSGARKKQKCVCANVVN